MKNDPIVDEVRRIRQAHAAQFEFDLDRIFSDLKRQERESGASFVRLEAVPEEGRRTRPVTEIEEVRVEEARA